MFCPFINTCLKTFNRHYSDHVKLVSLIPGDGIGPEISQSVIKIFDHLSIPIKFELLSLDSYEGSSIIPSKVLQSILKNKIGLK
ncbi:hypothetical protein MXB_1897, partial [Myxobolus squamalis]